MEKVDIIASVANAIDENQLAAGKAMVREQYPFEPISRGGGRVAPHLAARIFMRDGFVDRYSGKRLVYPGALRAMSILFPEEFPFHTNWKMDACHFAYYELCAVVDHVRPRARGGTNEESNLVTTTTIRNSVKANFTLEELGWKLVPESELDKWDGLMKWFVRIAGRYTRVLSPEDDASGAWAWYEAANAALAGRVGPWR